jgi:hypothetical protein
MKTKHFFFIKEPLILYRFHDDSIYSDRLKANPVKFLDEFQIRKNYYYKVRENLESKHLLDWYYLIRNLKILRVLISQKSKTSHVLREILKSDFVNFSVKLKILFYYLTSVYFQKGINKLRIK